jgi:hypothetical protein
MGNLFQRESKACRSFRDALEELPVKGGARRSTEEGLAELPSQDAAHAGSCEACWGTLEEFAETRQALAGMPLPEAGAWFTTRVMAAIVAREKEEEADGVWISVRRLAPRLVAVSALLLVVGGSWAVQQTRREVAKADGRSGDMVFDSPAAATWYDDGMGTLSEVRP